MTTSATFETLKDVRLDLFAECYYRDCEYANADELDDTFWNIDGHDRAEAIFVATLLGTTEPKVMPGKADGITVPEHIRIVAFFSKELPDLAKNAAWIYGVSRKVLRGQDALLDIIIGDAEAWTQKEGECGVYVDIDSLNDIEPLQDLASHLEDSVFSSVQRSGRGLRKRVEEDAEARTFAVGYTGMANSINGFQQRFDDDGRHKGRTRAALHDFASARGVEVDRTRAIIIDGDMVERCREGTGFRGTDWDLIYLGEAFVNARLGFTLEDGHYNFEECGGQGKKDAVWVVQHGMILSLARGFQNIEPDLNFADALKKADDVPAVQGFAAHSWSMYATDEIFHGATADGTCAGYLAKTGPHSLAVRIEREGTDVIHNIKSLTCGEVRSAVVSGAVTRGRENRIAALRSAAADIETRLASVDPATVHPLFAGFATCAAGRFRAVAKLSRDKVNQDRRGKNPRPAPPLRLQWRMKRPRTRSGVSRPASGPTSWAAMCSFAL